MSKRWDTRQSLLLKIKNQQDEHSWEEFIYFYKPYIVTVIMNLGVDQADVDDLAQKVLLVLVVMILQEIFYINH